MEYITYKRFKETAICGSVNIPAQTKCVERNGVIYHQNMPICYDRSYNAQQHFAKNHDNLGLIRGQHTTKIIQTLSKRDDDYQNRWNKIWEDLCCQKYKTHDLDFWQWDDSFFKAEIEDLQYIAKILNIKVGKKCTN